MDSDSSQVHHEAEVDEMDLPWIRWTFAAFLLLFSIVVIVGNPVAAYKAKQQGRSYSSIPLIGGLAGTSAILAMPVETSAWWAILPLLLDYTVLAFPIVLLYCLLRPHSEARP